MQGYFFLALKIILPEHKNIKIDHKNLEYKKTVILVIDSYHLWEQQF